MSKQELKKLPALEVTGVAYGWFGTALFSVIALISWGFHAQLADTMFAEVPQISTAAAALGVIGIAHVTRRARRITQRQK